MNHPAIAINSRTRTVRCGDAPVTLRWGLFDLLAALMAGEGKPVSQDALSVAMRGHPLTGKDDHAVYQAIFHLRRALPGLDIRTVYKRGYALLRTGAVG